MYYAFQGLDLLTICRKKFLRLEFLLTHANYQSCCFQKERYIFSEITGKYNFSHDSVGYRKMRLFLHILELKQEVI